MFHVVVDRNRNRCQFPVLKSFKSYPPKHELLNQILIKSLNQPYYLVGSPKISVKSAKECDLSKLFGRI